MKPLGISICTIEKQGLAEEPAQDYVSNLYDFIEFELTKFPAKQILKKLKQPELWAI